MNSAPPTPVEPPAYPPAGAQVLRREAQAGETATANRLWWNAAADAYQAEHGEFLGDERFIWGPEGLDESTVGLLGDVAGARVLEIGCGAGQCARALAARGATVLGLDIADGQLRHARRLNERTGRPVALIQADAQHLPLQTATFDIVCSAYGALPFVADIAGVFREVHRVLRPAGRFVFSVGHPVRWCFFDDPAEEGLVAVHSYFDRRAYVEQDELGRAGYVEHHRTVGDWIRALVSAGLVLDDLVEPTWPQENTQTWGGWSPLRGRIIPGTAIFACHRP